MVVRQLLGRGAWVDLLPGWLSCADEVFDDLQAQVRGRRNDARCTSGWSMCRGCCFYGDDEPLPHPTRYRAGDLNAHYGAELGEPFTTAGMCLYRDGRDSVAWHGDTIGRGRTEDTMVAIVSLGSPRDFLLRPRGGGATIRHRLGHGDLIVMGGSCQRTWEHAVPKTSRPVGPRISVQFRPQGVR